MNWGQIIALLMMALACLWLGTAVADAVIKDKDPDHPVVRVFAVLGLCLVITGVASFFRVIWLLWN